MTINQRIHTVIEPATVGTPAVPKPGDQVMLNPQPLPPGDVFVQVKAAQTAARAFGLGPSVESRVAINPQPLPPGGEAFVSPLVRQGILHRRQQELR